MQLSPYILSRLGPRELAQRLETCSDREIAEIIKHVDRKKLRKLILSLSSETTERLLSVIGPKRMAEVLAHMKDREAVSILRKLPKKARLQVFDHLPKRERTVYPFLLRFSKDVAGGWIRVDLLRVHPGESVTFIRKKLKAHDGYTNHVIVETVDGIFFGVIPIGILLHAPRRARAEDLAIGAETIDADADSEELARIFTNYNPDIVVVLDEGKVLGAVTREEAIPLIEKEHAEDIAKIFSMRGVEHVWTPIRRAIKNRGIWLVINLFTAFLAASVVNIFERTIQTFALLAVLMPIVPGEAGNATTQTMAIVVRGLATGELDRIALRRVLAKEIALGLINGTIVGLIALAFTLLWKGNVLASLALALAMPISLMIAALAGVAIPIILKKIGQDPASSSTIILTTITDVTGFFTFLGIATVLMKIWGVSV